MKTLSLCLLLAGFSFNQITAQVPFAHVPIGIIARQQASNINGLVKSSQLIGLFSPAIDATPSGLGNAIKLNGHLWVFTAGLSGSFGPLDMLPSGTTDRSTNIFVIDYPSNSATLLPNAVPGFNALFNLPSIFLTSNVTLTPINDFPIWAMDIGSNTIIPTGLWDPFFFRVKIPNDTNLINQIFAIQTFRVQLSIASNSYSIYGSSEILFTIQ